MLVRLLFFLYALGLVKNSQLTIYFGTMLFQKIYFLRVHLDDSRQLHFRQCLFFTHRFLYCPTSNKSYSYCALLANLALNCSNCFLIWIEFYWCTFSNSLFCSWKNMNFSIFFSPSPPQASLVPWMIELSAGMTISLLTVFNTGSLYRSKVFSIKCDILLFIISNC